MKTNKRPAYWKVKQDREGDERWRRQNRRVSKRLHLSYDDMKFCKYIHRQLIDSIGNEGSKNHNNHHSNHFWPHDFNI